MNSLTKINKPLSFLWFLITILVVLVIGYVVIKLSSNIGVE